MPGTLTPIRGRHQRPSQLTALVCFSHLQWDFVWQRPQHLLSRFAREFPVIVVEEPSLEADIEGAGELRIVERDGVTVVTPVLPADDATPIRFNACTNAAISALLAPFFAERGLDADDAVVVAWYYTPMALGAAPQGFAPALIVYDVMDELASFQKAPPELRSMESTLLRRADVVFTGGPSLYEARKHRHPAVYCFPSGVDADHFAHAADGMAPPADFDGRPRPIIGFYGVIDERLDLDLLRDVAGARPDWTIAMIGPIAKIEESALPRRENIVYLGKREYQELPAYLACFDVAILPFARNEATRFISPTKTLEYLAGSKPIVSTPIKDVVDLYGEAVRFGDGPAEFIAAVEATLTESPAEQSERAAASRRLLARHGWTTIADQMMTIMRSQAGRRLVTYRSRETGSTQAPARRAAMTGSTATAGIE